MCIISPLAVFYGGFVLNGASLPFVHVPAASTANPYSVVGSYNVNGPFFSQQNNVITYGLDGLSIDYIHT